MLPSFMAVFRARSQNRATDELTCVNVDGRKRGEACRVQPQVELRPLLGVLLSQLRRARETPLQFGIDSEGIVERALQEILPTATAPALRCDGSEVTAQLDELVLELLQPCDGGDRQIRTPAQRAPALMDATVHPLVPWLERLHAVLSNVQVQAVEIVALRLEGFEDRAIAHRLELGLALLRRISADARKEWSVTAEATGLEDREACPHSAMDATLVCHTDGAVGTPRPTRD